MTWWISHRKFYQPTPNKLFKSASLNLNGIFDTWRRLGPTLEPCEAVDVDVFTESGEVASPLSKSVCCNDKIVMLNIVLIQHLVMAMLR